MTGCPGRDRSSWTHDDIFDVTCRSCGEQVEFFKDDVSRKCPKCGFRFPNPRLDMGCLEWCPYADKCAAALAEGGTPGIPASDDAEPVKDKSD